MNSRLSLIARQVERREQQQAPAPVESSGLGAALEQVINEAVEARVQAALQEQKRQLEFSKPKPTYTDFKDLPPVHRAAAPRAMEVQLMRDELRRVNKITVGNLEFYVQRNELGQIVRFVPEGTVPLPPAVPPADINRGA
ncbi:MAG TPA: hypothetical protein DD418_20900 [Pseudomonas sp.]|uniref:hypothetical protein n=1 Tax=Pseudomonas sp. TaxID=306 RepID=UPI000E8E0DEB|nr:hypothetical protein [Pseudomonas sp.]MDX3742428.1 hypothetical protein [Pseudomonas sp.]HBM65943.1 hypothetical protein [Pseudomonas sp.]